VLLPPLNRLVVATALVTLPGSTFGCSARPPLEPMTTLRLEGAVVTAPDSLPFAGVSVNVMRAIRSGLEIIAGTRTAQDGSYWLVATVATIECPTVMLHVGTIGYDPGIARAPALRCTDDCQRLDFALQPPAISSHSFAEPQVGSCKS